MIFQTTKKLELNLFNQKTNPAFVCDFVIKYRMPVIVTPPEYVAAIVARRAVRSGQFKIIAAIDFPAGSNFALDKIYRSNVDLTLADGFEFLLSKNKTQIEIKNEMKTLHSFIKAHNSLLEVRWCISSFTRDNEDVVGIVKNMKQTPPSYIRLDNHLTIPNVDYDSHNKVASLVREVVPYPLKTSGNITYDLVKKLSTSPIKRFDVSLKQAESIIADIKKEMEEDRNALALSRNTEAGPEVSKPV